MVQILEGLHQKQGSVAWDGVCCAAANAGISVLAACPISVGVQQSFTKEVIQCLQAKLALGGGGGGGGGPGSHAILEGLLGFLSATLRITGQTIRTTAPAERSNPEEMDHLEFLLNVRACKLVCHPKTHLAIVRLPAEGEAHRPRRKMRDEATYRLRVRSRCQHCAGG